MLFLQLPGGLSWVSLILHTLIVDCLSGYVSFIPSFSNRLDGGCCVSMTGQIRDGSSDVAALIPPRRFTMFKVLQSFLIVEALF